MGGTAGIFHGRGAMPALKSEALPGGMPIARGKISHLAASGGGRPRPPAKSYRNVAAPCAGEEREHCPAGALRARLSSLPRWPSALRRGTRGGSLARVSSIAQCQSGHASAHFSSRAIMRVSPRPMMAFWHFGSARAHTHRSDIYQTPLSLTRALVLLMASTLYISL